LIVGTDLFRVVGLILGGETIVTDLQNSLRIRECGRLREREREREMEREQFIVLLFLVEGEGQHSPDIESVSCQFLFRGVVR
jgi:hypothetical protein